jgi:hypothetical protein
MAGHLEWNGFTRQRVFRIEPGLALPLKRVAFLGGDGGFGRSATHFLPCRRGVAVSRRGLVSLHTFDLAHEIWRVELQGWAGMLLYDGEHLWVARTEDGTAIEIAEASGEIVRRTPIPDGLVKGFTGETLCMGGGNPRAPIVFAVDRRTMAKLWERPGYGSCTSAGEKYMLDDEMGTVLRCVDARTGEVDWTFDVVPPAERAAAKAAQRRTNQIRAGFPSVVVVSDRVVVVTLDCAVRSLDLKTGELVRQASPPFPGISLVTERSVFFLQPTGLSEFDHGAMKETSRIEYPEEAAKLYGGDQRYPCAFWLTEESVIWTNLSGSLMGVARKGKGKRRDSWADRLPGAMFPIAKFPLAQGDYFFVADQGENLGLYSYQAAG